MKKLVKQLTYLVCGLLALVSTFLGFSTVSAKALSDSPLAIGAASAANDVLALNGQSKVTFFEFIGDFADNSQIDHKVTTIIAAILLLVAVVCAGIMLYSGIMSLVKGDGEALDTLSTKWVSVVAFAACLLSLLIMLIFPDSPEGMAGVYEINGAIGVGAILFLVSTGIAVIFSFVYPMIIKEK